jgi:type III pantothenate kinase
MILTVDIGNSRVKWALWMVEKIIDRGVISYGAYDGMKALDKLFATVQQPEKIFAVCVASEEMRRLLKDWVRQNWQLEVDYLKTEKTYRHITNAYHEPGQHGADRWASVVAGHQAAPGCAVCVIGAGTALTFDLIDRDGRHLGGYILPSYSSMRKALLSDTANINTSRNQRAASPGKEGRGADMVPVNSHDAVDLGLHKMLQAAIREICQHAKEKLGDTTEIIITGGWAKNIMQYPDMPRMQYKPDLVMQGLYCIKMQRNIQRH